jgi:hypothetical protein
MTSASGRGVFASRVCILFEYDEMEWLITFFEEQIKVQKL